MDTYSIIIQGEGKGHFSQASTFIGNLGDNAKVKRVYLGRSFFQKQAAYLHSLSNIQVKKFYSPNFIRTSNKKGIRIFPSLILNMLLAPVYIFEACRIRVLIKRDRSSFIYNFYDPIGALALRSWKKKGAERVIISHHFYLSHPDFIHPHGMEKSFFWLQFMNRFMLRSADRIQALSFRKGETFRKIEVIPPLIDRRIKEIDRQSGKRDLCYFLNPGFVTEMMEYYRNNPGLEADIFAEIGGKADFGMDALSGADEGIYEQVKIHSPSREAFIECMKKCNRIVATAGFDLVAEAFYLGIPIFLIPAENHYEQYCNALDASRTGMAFQLDSISDFVEVDFIPVGNNKFREWVNSK